MIKTKEEAIHFVKSQKIEVNKCDFLAVSPTGDVYMNCSDDTKKELAANNSFILKGEVPMDTPKTKAEKNKE